MKRLDISKSVTSPLESLLAGTRSQWLRVAPPRPVSYELFSSWDIPKKEIVSIPTGTQIAETTDPYVVQAKNALGADSITNAMVYGPMSCMFWHTNSDLIGIRTYYTLSLDKSVFRYKDVDTGEIKEDWDDYGWTAREFEITEANPLWHSVWTAGRRFSFGFTRQPASL
tara:strand:+ start:614 stop:1120 length:507 start_codon:yes stop_codon:yes gene_type:complete